MSIQKISKEVLKPIKKGDLILIQVFGRNKNKPLEESKHIVYLNTKGVKCVERKGFELKLKDIAKPHKIKILKPC